MDPYPLRAATEADVDALLAFWARAAENDARPADSADAIRGLIARDPEALVVATIGSSIVGSIISGWDGWRFHLYRLAVDPALRRHGIGRALLDAAEKRLIALGASRIDAMVLDGNELGQRIWSAAGYVRQDEWGRWVKPV
ncbi:MULTISPECIES: GNAT family N-acetyltransferase [unclassified Leifsonia]|uniref:GNAT family N-acetyltransferase n=1 Tax=unclassified Leifsonia TaxID=2663824 RepID=UPI0006F5F2A1|nr:MULTISPECIES: GNAT family N-acetyltransferase [unclassified Leifsonia]KQX04939.1 GCN5 family acetyltransferase [Leifsonia sp. Root1293]KRA08571.1 GCN5 family acetyltransferase [Leifsonia sp. Root60]